MKYICRLVIVLTLSPFLLFAQSNYKPGYIVTLKSDTVRGFVDFREWDGNPKFINFKGADNAVSKLTARDINAFGIEDKAEYIRYAGIISTDPINVNKMVSERDTSFRIDTVFLEVLQRGKHVALYSYNDDIKQRFYLGESPDYTPAELVYRVYFDVDNSKTGKTINEDTYQKTLFAILEKYNLVSDAIMRDFTWMSYREDDILQMVSKINDFKKKKAAKKH